MVHRVHDGQALNDEKNTAELVFGNGCRNPAYEPLAPYNPWRDPGNGLINNFDFRVFMFQEMLNGDSIMISAKVVACVEEIDCAPVSSRSLEIWEIWKCYGEMGLRQVERGFYSFFAIFLEYLMIFDIFTYAKYLAKNEEKPCST